MNKILKKRLAKIRDILKGDAPVDVLYSLVQQVMNGDMD